MKINYYPKIQRIYRLVLFLLVKSVSKPQYILIFFWAFKRLWQVDRQLKELALMALNLSADEPAQAINLELQQKIRQRVVAIAWAAKLHPLRPKCLHRSLVLYQWLQQQGITPQLEVGWGDNIGHAWVSYGGRVLNDRQNVAESRIPLTK